MRKLMKLALEEEQIKTKSQYSRFDGYEIHLYGNLKDDFSLSHIISKPIITVHYPIARCDVNDVVNEFETEYAQKVYAFCKKVDAGLVIHAETGVDRLVTNPHLEKFCKFIREQGIRLHVENCYRNIGAIQGLKLAKFLQKQIGEDLVFPLLDTCHLIMSEMSFKFEEMSFFKTIEAYASDNYVIHLNDCIGSGEKETGGIHGTNFYANRYLLGNILWKLHELEDQGTHVDLVLEVDEFDYVYPSNADILAKNVDLIWSSI